LAQLLGRRAFLNPNHRQHEEPMPRVFLLILLVFKRINLKRFSRAVNWLSKKIEEVEVPEIDRIGKLVQILWSC
jgi:hypothetical protein